MNSFTKQIILILKNVIYQIFFCFVSSKSENSLCNHTSWIFFYMFLPKSYNILCICSRYMWGACVYTLSIIGQSSFLWISNCSIFWKWCFSSAKLILHLCPQQINEQISVCLFPSFVLFSIDPYVYHSASIAHFWLLCCS